MPGGSCRSTVCDTAVICVSARWTSAPGWKNILMIERPATVCDSMCSMLSTTVVMNRSKRDDPVFHLLRGEAGIVPGDADDRNVNVRENVGGRALQHDRSNQQDDQRGHDERIGAVERDSYNPHASGL